MTIIETLKAHILNIFSDNSIDTDFSFTKKDAILVILFFSASLILRFILLSETPYANGTDGYVYIIQVRSIIEEGRMHFRDVSLIYPYFTIISLVVKNYILAFKVGIAGLTGFFCVVIYLLSASISSRRDIGGLIACISIFSPSITFFALQFPKNFLALVFFITFLYCITRKNIWGIFLFFIGAAISHRLMAGILIIYTLLSFLSLRKYKIILTGSVILLLLLFIISILLPGTLHIYDMERFRGILNFYPQAAPFSFISMMGFNSLHFIWKLELLIYFCIILFSIYLLLMGIIRKNIHGRIAVIITILSCLLVFPFFTFNISGIAYRFYLLSLPFAMVLLIPIVKNINKYIIYAVISVIVILTIVSAGVFNFSRFDPPYSLYTKISVRIEKFIKDKSCTLLVVHKPFAELLDYELRMDALPWKPECELVRKGIWRIAKDIDIWEVESIHSYNELTINRNDISQLSPHYIIIREDLWESFAGLVKDRGTDDLKERVFSGDNPNRIRPSYITRKKNSKD